MSIILTLILTFVFFGVLQGQTKNGDWVLSSTKNYNQLTKEAKDKIESELNNMVKTYADSMKKRFESSYYITEENCESRTDYSAWDPKTCEGHPEVNNYLITAAQSESPNRFIDLEPGLTALGWSPIAWPNGPENLQ